MNDPAPVPRHRQRPIAFRSDKAAKILAQLTRDGRSQAKVIEEALEQVLEQTPPPAKRMSREEFMEAINAIVRPLRGSPGKSREEIEAEIYDEYGAPR